MKKSLLISMLLLCCPSIPAEEPAPKADFGVHTIVSSGPRTFEGDKLRAIVEYGELGFPSIYIESIHVEMGYPSPSKVLWREKIDWSGGIDNICREPGIWPCSLENLQWEDSAFHYDLKTPAETYRCSATVSEERKIETSCTKP
jgi:hypothetical protein